MSTAVPGPDPDGDLSALQARLDELQETVRRLGSEESPPPRVAATPPEPAPVATNGLSDAAPAATNGHSNGGAATAVDPTEISARSNTVALVDAGPFADLIELRHFEEDLARLAPVSEVRVRRFGHRRATIEVGMTAAHDLACELPAIPRPMRVEVAPDGEVIVELDELEAGDADAEETA
jgi:hypothetical protein